MSEADDELDDAEDEAETTPSPAAAAVAQSRSGKMQFLPGVVAPGSYPFTPPTAPAEVYPTGTEELEAGAAGLGRGVTFGLSDVGLTKSGLVSRETLEHLKKVAPGPSSIGELLGSGASAVALGGLGQGLGLAGRVGVQAAIGGGMGLGTALSEDSLGEAPLTAEHVAGSVGLGALFGGGSEALLGLAAKAVPKIVDAFGDAAGQASGALGDVDKPGWRQLMGHAQEATSDEQLALENDWDKAALMNAKQSARDSGRAFANSIQDVQDTSSKALSQFWPEHEAQMRETLTGADAAPAMEKSLDFVAKAKAQLEAMRADPATYTNTGVINRFGKLVDGLEEDIGDLTDSKFRSATDYATRAADIQSTIVGFRRDLDKSIPWQRINALDPLAKDTIDAVRSVRGAANDLAGDATAFGKAGHLYTDTNKLFSQHQSALDDVLGFFGNKEGDIDTKKVTNFLTQDAKDDVAADAKMQALREYTQKAQDLHQGIKARFGELAAAPETDIGAALDRLQDAQGEATSATDAAVSGVKPTPGYAQTFQGLERGVGEKPPTASGLGLAALMGHSMGMGPLVEGVAGGLAALKALPTLPTKAIRVMAQLQKIAGVARAATRGAARDAIEGTSSAAVDTVAGKAPEALQGIDLAGGSAVRGEGIQSAAARVSQQVQELAGDQMGAMNRMGSALQHLQEHAPAIGANLAGIGLRGLQFLALQAPKNPYRGVGMASAVADAAWKPSMSESQKFESYVLGTLYPFRTLKRVAAGTATAAEMQAVGAVWPELKKDVSGAIVARMAKHPEKLKTMPYQRRIMLSNFTGQPTDPTMLPANLAKWSQPSLPPPPQGGLKKSGKMPLHGKLTLGSRLALEPSLGKEE